MLYDSTFLTLNLLEKLERTYVRVYLQLSEP